MSERVKSVILVGPGKLAVKEISVPNVTPPAHRVRMMACGICGSDVRYLAGENPWSLHTVGKNLDSPPNMVLGHEIADTISFEEATFLDGLAVAIHACDRARVVQGSRVAVLGLGPIGMLAAQVARARGAEHVMACDTTALPVELARGLGFESAAQSDGHAMRLSAERYVTTSANSPYPDFQRAIDLLSSGRVSVAPLITHRFPLSDAVRAFEVMAQKDEHRAYKVVIVP